jgi:hypothetical protein
MNGKFWMVGSASLLAALWTWGGNPLIFDASAAEKESQSKAVIVLCVVNTGPPEGGGPTSITVFGSSSSAGAPVVQSGSECAQALASVLAAGLQLDNVTTSPFGMLQYTLIK